MISFLCYGETHWKMFTKKYLCKMIDGRGINCFWSEKIYIERRERERERCGVVCIRFFLCVSNLEWAHVFRPQEIWYRPISPYLIYIYMYIYTCCSFFFFFFTLFSYMINTILDIYYKFILLNCRILLVLQLNPYLFVLWK